MNNDPSDEHISAWEAEQAAAAGDFWSMLHDCVREAGGNPELVQPFLEQATFAEGLAHLASNGIRPVFMPDKNRNTKAVLAGETQ